MKSFTTSKSGKEGSNTYSFSKLRDIESAFHDRILTLGMQEMQKFSKNEIDRELTDEAKTVCIVISVLIK